MVEFAIVEEHVGVGVRGDGEGALADLGADEGPGFALTVPEADTAVARSCGDQVGVPEALQARAIAVRRRSWVRPGDHARMLAAHGREQDTVSLRTIRRLIELERQLGLGIER